ncbi:uncharacterized protein LOC144666043 [Oculina patagonica]
MRFLLLYVLMISISCAKTPKGKPKVIDASGQSISRGVHSGIAFANFRAHKFSYLNITSLGTGYIFDGKECGVACVNIPSCFSFNLAAFYDINGKILCELLPSDKYNNSDKFVPSQFFHHFSIRSPCISGPCQNNATCVSLYERNSYMCLCTKGYKGRHCETSDVCHGYQILDNTDRKVTHISQIFLCDNNLSPGWYRFQGDAGTRMPTTCPNFALGRCGTLRQGWLNGAHPKVEDGEVERQLCFSFSTCCSKAVFVKVKNCGSYYVYKLDATPGCDLRYCGTD